MPACVPAMAIDDAGTVAADPVDGCSAVRLEDSRGK